MKKHNGTRWSNYYIFGACLPKENRYIRIVGNMMRRSTSIMEENKRSVDWHVAVTMIFLPTVGAFEKMFVFGG